MTRIYLNGGHTIDTPQSPKQVSMTIAGALQQQIMFIDVELIQPGVMTVAIPSIAAFGPKPVALPQALSRKGQPS